MIYVTGKYNLGKLAVSNKCKIFFVCNILSYFVAKVQVHQDNITICCVYRESQLQEVMSLNLNSAFTMAF